MRSISEQGPGSDINSGNESSLERRFKDVGARALIEETDHISTVVLGISKRLADLERSVDLLRTLLDFPLPLQGELTPPLMASVVVTARMLCNAADGFHGLEVKPDGTTFRWTGPEAEFRFLVNINRERAGRGELSLLNDPRVAAVAEIPCYIDREWVATELHRSAEGDRLRVTFKISELQINRATEIIFVAPSLFRPALEDADNPDQRTLGVGFVELRLAAGIAESHSQ
jgi:hypothetical protein